MSTTNTSDKDYILGHSKEELERLERQATFFRATTRNLLMCAGITTGMRVVDFGCGAGDLAILLSELVGESGQVIAVDRAPKALEQAQHRMAAMGLKNVATMLGDENRLAEVFQANKVDAVVGRLIMMHQKDVTAVLCKLVKSIRPGGIVAFQESELDHCPIWTKPALPLMLKTWDWMSQAAMAAGIPGDVGIQLMRAFDQAGIQARHIAREGILETGPDALGYVFHVDGIRALLPLLQKFNVATPEEVGLETLESRLRDEAAACQAVFIPIYFLNAYGRTPA